MGEVSVMSVEVLNASVEQDSAPKVKSIATDLYSLFLSDSAKATPPAANAGTLVAAHTIKAQPALPAKTQGAPGAPQAIGCGVPGVTKSVVVIAGINGERERLRVALERTRATATIARDNGNQLHYVFLGGALPPHGTPDEGVLDWVLSLKEGTAKDAGKTLEHVHLIAGPREIDALSVVASSDRARKSRLQEYLKASVLVECLGPQSMDETGDGGLWLKCTSTKGAVGKLPGAGILDSGGPRVSWVESPVPLSHMKWKDEFNRRWHEVAADPWSVRENQHAKWQFWRILGAQAALDDEQFPAQGLQSPLSGRAMAAFARETAAFGTVRRTLAVDKKSRMHLPGDLWLDVGAASDSLYWAVSTWCHSTMNAINSHALPPLDRTPTLDDLQYDVSCTLSSLVQHTESTSTLAPSVAPWANFGQLRGLLGPCVLAGRDGREVMRLVHWSGRGMPDVVMLLPEAYVRVVLQDYFHDLVAVSELGAQSTSGFAVLHNVNAVALRLPNLTEAEQADAAASMGTRIWSVHPIPPTSSKELADEMIAAPKPWRALLRFSSHAEELVPGHRIESNASRTVFYTHQSSADPVAGLWVKWVFAPGASANARDLPTLEVDNDAFETVV